MEMVFARTMILTAKHEALLHAAYFDALVSGVGYLNAQNAFPNATRGPAGLSADMELDRTMMTLSVARLESARFATVWRIAHAAWFSASVVSAFALAHSLVASFTNTPRRKAHGISRVAKFAATATSMTQTIFMISAYWMDGRFHATQLAFVATMLAASEQCLKASH